MSVPGAQLLASQAVGHPARLASLYRKVSWRLMPFLFLGYAVAYLDRINIGFAQLQLSRELGFSSAVYGLGAGLFFLSYFVCEVPSNFLLERIGARRTIARILIGWGIVSAGMMFLRTPMSFYIMRILLGVFEAGFAPGVMLYLTYWYPNSRRARVTALFLSGGTVAGIIGGPVSGFILEHMNGYLTLSGWQWLFLLEGAPSVALGLAAVKMLPDSPQDAHWLTKPEVTLLTTEIAEESARRDHTYRLANVVRDPNVYVLIAGWFAIVCGLYAIAFWTPMLIREAGVTRTTEIGLWAAVPFVAGALGMMFMSKSSDRTLERKWHIVLSMFFGGAALLSLAFAGGSLARSVVSLSVAAAALFGAMPVFWAVPMAYFSRSAAPAGIALVNCVGLIGGFVSPFLLGMVKQATGSLTCGLYVMAALLMIGSFTTLYLFSWRTLALASGPDKR